MRPIESQEELNIVKKIKNYFSNGEDEVPTSIVKKCITVIVNCIVFIIDNTFNHEIYRGSFKLAIVKPVLKRGES